MNRWMMTAGVITCGILTMVDTTRANESDQNSLAVCRNLPSHAEIKDALDRAQDQGNGGFGLEMWVSVVNRDGVVCAVAFTGNDRGDQWPGSRVISAQKANTANAFSLPGLALSTANLYTAIQPGGSLFGLQASNPVDTDVAYAAIRPPMGGATTRWLADELVA